MGAIFMFILVIVIAVVGFVYFKFEDRKKGKQEEIL